MYCTYDKLKLLKRHAETYVSQKRKIVVLAVLIYVSVPPALCAWKGQWMQTVEVNTLRTGDTDLRF